LTGSLSKAKTKFSSLSPQLQTEFLLAFAANLTIAAREDYDPAGEEIRPNRSLKGINEIIHHALGQIASARSGAAGYPIETLFSIFEEEAAASGTQSDIAWAAQRACETTVVSGVAQAS